MEDDTSQIKVANVIEDGRLAGPQKRIMMVASVLNKKIETKIIFPKKNSEEFKLHCSTFNVKYLPLSLTTMSNNLTSILKYLVLFPYEILILLFTFKKHRFDLVHVSGGCWQFKGVIAAKLAKLKVIWHLNDTKSPFFIRKIFSFLSSSANSFIFASEKTKEYYINLIPSKTKNFLIQSPVDTDHFDPNIKYPIEELKKKYLLEKKTVIGTIGNINRNKDHITLLKTAKIISSYSKDMIFLIVGPVYQSQKKYFTSLMDMIKKEEINNILFLDGKEDVRPFLKIMDIYVCSSDNEASPLSVWEAMSMEKAVVSTDVGDVGKFINNGINGFIVNRKDSNALAKRIINLVEAPELKNNFGKSARLVVKNKLNLNLCAKLHNEVYKETILHNDRKF
tara:strand:- start:113 stop:1291 length:1179 start_codon:yes stop_codon:yes gene_type:complete